MKSKRRKMLAFYYLPGIIALIRIVVTFWFLIANPLDLQLRFIQVLLIGVYIVTLFKYYKLYSDGVPVISLIAPTILHAIVVVVFTKSLAFIPFLILIGIDILFLVFKGIKANLFPFDIEGDEDDEAILEELENEADAG